LPLENCEKQHNGFGGVREGMMLLV